jgi:hypothetical protein
MFSLFQRTKQTILRRIFWSPNERQSGKKRSSILICFSTILLNSYWLTGKITISYGILLIFSLIVSLQKYCSLIGSSEIRQTFHWLFFLNLWCSHRVPWSAKSFKKIVLWRIVFSYVNLFICSMCLANGGASEGQFILVT